MRLLLLAAGLFVAAEAVPGLYYPHNLRAQPPPDRAEQAMPPWWPDSEHVLSLSPNNFDRFVSSAAQGEHTVLIRWVGQADTVHCKWFSEGMEHAIQLGLTHGHDPDDTCAILEDATKAWQEVARRYAGNPQVIFGEVVVAEFPDLVAQAHKDGKMPWHGGDAQEGDPDPDHRNQEPELEDTTLIDTEFGIELAEFIHNSDIGGCTIRHYNAETGPSLPGWSPHCADLMIAEHHDKPDADTADYLEGYVAELLENHHEFLLESYGIRTEV